MEHAKLTKYKDMTPVKEDRWFKVYKLPNDIYAIFEPYHFQEVACFLVIGSEKALLFDTGMGVGDVKAMVESLTDLPLTVVNSHSHFDHIGGDWQFDEVYMNGKLNIETWGGSWQTLPRDDDNLSAEAFQDFPGGLEAFWMNPNDLVTREPKKILHVGEGDIFNLGNRSFRVIETPGHSDDGIMLIDDEHKIMLTGDTIYPAAIYAHLGESNLTVYTEVVHKLADQYSDYLMYCSHNNPVWEGKALLEIAAAFDEVVEKRKAEEAAGIQHEITRYEFDGADFAIMS